MRTLVDVKPQKNYTLQCTFDNGIAKTVDLSETLNLPVFSILKKENNFLNLINKKYFIEWPNFELDLSADTLLNLQK